MKVIYRVPMLQQIAEAKSKALVENRVIERIELTKAEYERLEWECRWRSDMPEVLTTCTKVFGIDVVEVP